MSTETHFIRSLMVAMFLMTGCTVFYDIEEVFSYEIELHGVRAATSKINAGEMEFELTAKSQLRFADSQNVGMFLIFSGLSEGSLLFKQEETTVHVLEQTSGQDWQRKDITATAKVEVLSNAVETAVLRFYTSGREPLRLLLQVPVTVNGVEKELEFVLIPVETFEESQK